MPEDYALNLEEMKRMMASAMGTNLAGQSMAGPVATGQAYAQQIAGGMPFEDVVAPGMSFSPDQPMGYTQADLRKKEIYGDFDGVMPKAPTKGTPFAPNEGFVQMPSAPQGVSAPTMILPGQTAFPGIPSFLQGLDFSSLQGLDFSSLQDLDFSSLPGAKPVEPKEDFFKIDQNLFNFEGIADKMDMDELAKIDIENIDIPESVSLFSDILNEPAPLDNLFTETAPGIFSYDRKPDSESVVSRTIERNKGATTKTETMRDGSKRITNPDGSVTIVPAPAPTPAPFSLDNLFTETAPGIFSYDRKPDSESVVSRTIERNKGATTKTETMRDGSKRITNPDGSVTIEPAPPPVPQTPAFVQPNIDEIVRPISRQNKFSTQTPGLFNLA